MSRVLKSPVSSGYDLEERYFHEVNLKLIDASRGKTRMVNASDQRAQSKNASSKPAAKKKAA